MNIGRLSESHLFKLNSKFPSTGRECHVLHFSHTSFSFSRNKRARTRSEVIQLSIAKLWHGYWAPFSLAIRHACMSPNPPNLPGSLPPDPHMLFQITFWPPSFSLTACHNFAVLNCIDVLEVCFDVSEYSVAVILVLKRFVVLSRF